MRFRGDWFQGLLEKFQNVRTDNGLLRHALQGHPHEQRRLLDALLEGAAGVALLATVTVRKAGGIRLEAVQTGLTAVAARGRTSSVIRVRDAERGERRLDVAAAKVDRYRNRFRVRFAPVRFAHFECVVDSSFLGVG